MYVGVFDLMEVTVDALPSVAPSALCQCVEKVMRRAIMRLGKDGILLICCTEAGDGTQIWCRIAEVSAFCLCCEQCSARVDLLTGYSGMTGRSVYVPRPSPPGCPV